MRLARPGGSPIDCWHSDRGLDRTAFRIALFPEDIQHLGTQVPLDDYLPVLRGAAYAAFHFQEFPQGGQILGSAPEPGDQGNHLPSPVPFVQGYAQSLFLLRQRIFLLRISRIILKIGIRGVHHA